MVVDALLHLTRTGTQWRNIDSRWLSKLSIIQYYFYKWQKNGVWNTLLATLVADFREKNGDERSPSRVALDSQSVKSVPFVSEDRGIDGGKLVNGRKRHTAVDKHGLPLAIAVTAANVNDGKAGLELLWQLEENKRLKLFCLDSAYEGDFTKALELYDWEWEIAQKPEGQSGFIPQNGRWQVERSFAWMNFYRRLSKDYEKTARSAITFIQIAFINMILAKISRIKI